MPRGKGKTSKSPAPAARRSSRGAPESSPTKPTRGSVSQSPAPKRGRKASPSPSPAGRQASRGRKGKAVVKEPSPEPEKKTKSRGRSHQGQGDSSEEVGKGRVTRAVIQEAETPKQGRGRSGSRKVQPPATPEAASRSSSRQKAQTSSKAKTPSKAQTSSKAKTPSKSPIAKGKTTPAKKGKGRGRGSKASEQEAEEEENEEEEEEEETPKSTPKQRGRGRGAGKATPKSVDKATAKGKNTPNKSPQKKQAASPSPTRKGRQGKGAEAESEPDDPQVVLKKVDSPEKKSPKASPRAGRKAQHSAAKSPSKSPTKSPRGRGRQSAGQEKETESEEITSTEAEEERKPDAAKEEIESKDETDATAEVVEETDVKAEDENEKMEEIEEEPSDQLAASEAQKEESEKVVDEVEKMEEDEAPTEETTPIEEDDVAPAEDQPSPQANGEESLDHSPAKKRKLDEDDVTEDMSVKKARVEEEETYPVENGAETEEAVENDVEAMDQGQEDEAESQEDAAESKEDEDYVIINKDEVPDPSSKEVLESVPREVTPVMQEPPEESMQEEVQDLQEEEQEDIAKEEETTETIVEDVVTEHSEILKDSATEAVVENEVVATDALPSEADQEEVLESETVEEPVLANSCPEVSSEEPVVQQQDQVQDVQCQPEVVDNVAESVTNCVIPNQNDQTQAAIPKPSSTTDWVVSRKFMNNPGFNVETSDPSRQFSVASYNILAQCHLDRNDYSFTEACYLDLDYRHEKLMKEMKFLDADIVCMQEVGPSYFESKLLPAMREIGYEGIMMKRTDDYYDEGEASFYKTSRFTPIQTQTYSLKQLAIQNELIGQGLDEALEDSLAKYLDRPDILIIMQLQCNNTKNIITIGNIHVHWGKMEVPDVQCVQIASAIKEVVTKAGSDGHPHILCGDFNSEVTSPGYQLCSEGYLSDAMIQYLQNMENLQLPDGNKTSLVNHLWRAFQHTSSGLKSAYAVAQNSEPVVTSYNRVMKAAVDYIFYSANCIDNVGILEVSPESAICATGGIPDSVFPSDHVSLMAKFSFK